MGSELVETKSAVKSKINWTQIVTILSMIAVHFGVDVDTETQVMIVTAIASVSAVVTWVLRTWFNNTVTPK